VQQLKHKKRFADVHLKQTTVTSVVVNNSSRKETSMTTTLEKPAPIARNGVDVPTLLATINFVGENPEAAKFQFRTTCDWVEGTHSKTTIGNYYGAGAEQDRDGKTFNIDADHTTVLCGTDMGPTPVEYLLQALAACLTAGIGNIASARGIDLLEVSSNVEGDIDVQGILGLSDEVRNGFNAIRVTFKIVGDAPVETLEKILKQSIARSAVYDVLTNGVKVDVTSKAA
jgi:uncharacterized OsmC-like protein